MLRICQDSGYPISKEKCKYARLKLPAGVHVRTWTILINVLIGYSRSKHKINIARCLPVLQIPKLTSVPNG